MKIEEAGLIVNKNDGAYPKNNNILLLAGGAGSGKGFILEKLILFEGKLFNVDLTKEYLLIYAKKRPFGKLCKDFKKTYGYEMKDINLKNAEQTKDLHDFVNRYRLASAPEAAFFKAASAYKTKPNVIFDMTMKDYDTLNFMGQYINAGGYDPKNVHIVWILNDVKVALDQNAKRSRVVPQDILVSGHNGVAKTMKGIIDTSEKWQSIVDGDIWIVFNKKDVDVKTTIQLHRQTDSNPAKFTATMTIDDYVSIHMKERGKPAKKFKDIEKPLLDKILEYVPDEAKKYLTTN